LGKFLYTGTILREKISEGIGINGSPDEELILFGIIIVEINNGPGLVTALDNQCGVIDEIDVVLGNERTKFRNYISRCFGITVFIDERIDVFDVSIDLDTKYFGIYTHRLI
jgi:hypothetical protein